MDGMAAFLKEQGIVSAEEDLREWPVRLPCAKCGRTLLSLALIGEDTCDISVVSVVCADGVACGARARKHGAAGASKG